MNIIELVKHILTDYPKITEFTNEINIDFTGDTPTNFGLSSMGDQKISEDILGNHVRQHNFVLYAVNQSFTDYNRLTNSTFLLDLAYWLEQYKQEDPIEVTINDKTVSGKLLRLSSANAMLYMVPTGDINDGVTYQIQIYARYYLESEVI